MLLNRVDFSFQVPQLISRLTGFIAISASDPRKAPFLPRHLIGNVARFTFHTLLLPLIYGTIASAVTIESVGNYWFVIVGGFGVLGISYLTATLVRYCIPISNERDFCALRIAATFPNIVALPILIFPSLCEFPVVHQGFISHGEEDTSPQFLESECVNQANTMVFCYFISWSLAFWSFGSPQLLQAAKQGNTQREDINSNTRHSTESSKSLPPNSDEEECSEELHSLGNEGLSLNESEEEAASKSAFDDTSRNTLCKAVRQTATSPGFVAMVLAFVTACIPPLQRALFEAGAPLRFLGSAIETLGVASTPISTMVVAATLVPPKEGQNNLEEQEEDEDDDPILDENPVMADPNFGPYKRRRHHSKFQSFRRSMRSGSIRILKAMPRSSPEMKQLHTWFCLSRLFVTPAAVVGIILALECGGGLLDQVPNLAKLVIIINAALPGALIVAVILKSEEELAETAAALARVYFSSYLVSILTIAAWTAVGLWITLPDENGKAICQR